MDLDAETHRKLDAIMSGKVSLSIRQILSLASTLVVERLRKMFKLCYRINPPAGGTILNDLIKISGAFDDDELKAIDVIVYNCRIIDEDLLARLQAKNGGSATEACWNLKLKAGGMLWIWDSALRKLGEDETGPKDASSFIEWVKSLQSDLGLDSSFAALREGVPAEDIVA